MSGPANVLSIDAIRDFVPAVALVQEELKAVISALQIEMQRGLSWIEQDRPRYWQSQLKRAFDRVAETRTAVTTCQMRTVAGRRPSCIEEKEAFSAAKRRLEFCQGQIEAVKRWGVKLRHEADEFRGRIAGCQRMSESDLTKAFALLARIIESLEKYSETFDTPVIAPSEPEA